MKTPLITFSALLQAIYVSASPVSVNLNARNKLICGQAGYDAGTESFWGSTVDSFAACSSACTQQGCKSFAYGSGECQLYDVAVRSNFVAVKDSPYLFYNSGCVADVVSTTSTTSLVSTTKAVVTTPTTTGTSKIVSTTSSTSPATTAKSTTSSTTNTASQTTSKANIFTPPSTTRTSTQTTMKTTTTTTPKLTSTTTTTSAATPSDTLICGQQGYFSGSSGFHGYPSNYDEPTQPALSECYQYCVNSDEGYCAGWTWSSGSCVLFSYAPEGSHYQSSPDSGYYVWDRRCGAPVAM